MTTKPEYVNRIDAVDTVTDGDTYVFSIRKDIGFRFEVVAHPEIRLDGYDTPERYRGSAFERREALRAREFVEAWFAARLDAGVPVYVRTRKDDRSFTRWIGDIWAERSILDRERLGAALVAAHLAVVDPPPFDTTWHSVYDPQRDRS